MTDLHSSRPPKVVVGVDGSSPSKLALRWGSWVADRLGGRVEAVAAWHFPATFGLAYVPPEMDPAQSTEKALSASVDEVFAGGRPADLRLAVKEGNAARVLLDESEDAVMLVVGSRGHGGFAGLLLGSVSASVAEHATCPVLVVHGERLPPEDGS